MEQSKYDVLSPDGFSIDREETYSSIDAARVAFEKWKKNFKHQGYYGTVKNGQRVRIPLDELDQHMTVKLIK